MNKDNNLQYEYTEYFEILEILGKHYFHDVDNLIYLSIDENELDDLLIDVRGNKSGIEHLVDSCREVLSIGRTELFENLIGLTNTWSEENNGYPPQLCFVSLFIIAATRMGENSEVIDWRNYYQQVVNLLRLDIQSNTFGEFFRRDFGDREDQERQLFKLISFKLGFLGCY